MKLYLKMFSILNPSRIEEIHLKHILLDLTPHIIFHPLNKGQQFPILNHMVIILGLEVGTIPSLLPGKSGKSPKFN